MDFHVGDMVVITDGKKGSVCVIDGVKKGYLRVGSLLFDWTGKEVDAFDSIYRIYPLAIA